MKSYASLPLRAQEDVIEEFGVSRKYTYLLIGAGLVTITLGIVAYLSTDDFARSLSSGAGVLAPLLASALWVGLLILGVYIAGVGFYLEFAYQYFLTNQRVIQSEGLFSKRSASSEYDQINDIVVRQDFINRLFLGTGTIGISTPGTASEEYQLINIDHSHRRAELIRDLIRYSAENRVVDKYLVAHLMVKNNLCTTEQEALDKLDVSVGKDPTAEATFGVISPAFEKHQIEFHGAEPQRSDVVAQSSDNPVHTAPIAQSPVEQDTEHSSVAPSAQPSFQSEADPSVKDQPVVPELAQAPTSQPDPIPVQPTPVAEFTPLAPTSTNADAGVEDLLGDGIDESDRLRAAQKKMASNTADPLIDSDGTDTK